jgi:hypothetical protein
MNDQSQSFSIFVISLFLGLISDIFFYGKAPGISFPLFIAIVLLIFCYFAYIFRMKLYFSILWLVIPLLFFASMVAIRSSGWLNFFNIVASTFILLLIARKATGAKIRRMSVGDYLDTIKLPINFLQTAPSIWPPFREKERENKTAAIFKGILMSFPFLAFFVFLFSVSDPYFKILLSNIFNFRQFVSLEALPHFFFVGFITFLFCGALFFILHPFDNKKAPCKIADRKTIEAGVFLGSINALFFIFILIQAAYLFGGQNIIESQGIAYAEYAKRGFFELIVVALVSFLIIWSRKNSMFEKTEKSSFPVKIMGLTLIVQVVVILASAFIRLSLYEQAYGLTIFRFYSHITIIWLAAALTALLIVIAANRKETVFALYCFSSLVFLLAILNLINPDAFIAQRNMERFSGPQIGKLDVYYLSTLSDDALPIISKLLDSPDSDIGNTLAHGLYENKKTNSYWNRNDWQSYNLSHQNALRIIGAYSAKIEANKDYQCRRYRCPNRLWWN